MDWYFSVLKNYAVFEGRARRKEYWYFLLCNSIITALLLCIDVLFSGVTQDIGTGLLTGFYNILMFIPALAVAVRRLHDTNRSGWWLLLLAIPVIGGLVIFIFMIQNSQVGTNDYGINSKGMI
jgi:uncharacterized membrane protein YhaH (DUF805 family)